MERDIRYLYVGVAVALLVAAFVGFLLWQAEHHADIHGARYTVFVDGSVSGLGRGSVVRYLGVRVGRVRDIRLSRDDARRVEVDIEVREEVPVNRSTVARVQAQGITGKSYVSLRTSDSTAGPAQATSGSRYPVIHAQPSTVDELMTGVPRLVERLTTLAENMDRVFDERNRQNITQMLENGRAFSGRLDGLVTSIEQLAGRASESLDTLDGAVGEVGNAAEQLGPALAGLRDTSRSLGRLSDRMDAMIADNRAAVDRFSRVGLPEASRLLREARAAVNEIEQLARRLNENPSSLLHRRPEGGLEVPQ